MVVKINFRAVVFVVTSLLFLLSGQFALAQGTAGVGISPAIINERVEPGQVKEYTLQLRNLSGADQTYFISKRDIIGVKDGNVPIFSKSKTERTGYEVSDWITLDREEIFIPAAGEGYISFVLTVPDVATPGSHFGGVIVSVEAPEIRSSGASIGYEVANIISIRVSGEANDSAKIRQFSTSQYIYGKTEVDFEARVENEGNTLVTPVGPLEIYNMFGKQVALLAFNESQKSVFPKTSDSEGITSFNISWADEGVGFGRYEAILSLSYGEEGRKSTMSNTVTFWVLPMNIVGPGLAILAVLLLVLFIGIKLYVRRSVAMLSNSGSTRRLIRSRQQNQFPVILLLASMLAVTTLFLIILLLLFA